MRIRQLSPAGDMLFGRNQANFIKDIPGVPGQRVKTRLGLVLGEWFLDTSDGTPYQTKILGKYTGDTRDPSIRARILGTPGVTGIATYASQVNRQTRGYAVQTTIDTTFGQVLVAAVASAPQTNVRFGR